MIWNSAELVLQENGTFTYHGRGCYGQPFSQGQWTDNKGIVQLTSFDEFKPSVQTDTVSLAGDWAKGKRRFKKGKVAYAGPGNIPPPVLTGPEDTVRIYLDKVQLRLRKDTLLCIGPEPFFGDRIFIRNMHVR